MTGNGSTWMSIDDRARRTREILESTPRRAVQSHAGYEQPSLPPPPKRPSLAARAVKGTGDAVREHLRDVVKIVIVAIVGTGIAWFRSRASSDDLEAVKKQCAADAAIAIASAVASATKPIEPLANRVRARERHDAKEDQRWDKLDAWHAKQRRPNTMPPPKFGPAAEAHGDVRFNDLEDE